jgi:hypothetical protein
MAIRALRAAPPGRAERSGKRRGVFGSALQQSEELASAASAVGNSSKPLLLFYAMSQAGRAINAAWSDGQPWQPIAHGIRVQAAEDLPSTQIELDALSSGADAYGLLSRAVGSPPFRATTTFARLWASLPELPRTAEILGDETPCLPVVEARPMAALEGSLAASPKVTEGLIMATRDTIASTLASFPAARGWRFSSIISTDPALVSTIRIGWDDEAGRPRPLHTAAVQVKKVFWLRPALEAKQDPPSMLMTWWLLLIALSTVARYHPELWARALNVERSPIAVSLEAALRIAESRVPELIREGLNGPPLRLEGLPNWWPALR